ncbi:unnamed protein product, partial [Rotaria socialis]
QKKQIVLQQSLQHLMSSTASKEISSESYIRGIILAELF